MSARRSEFVAHVPDLLEPLGPVSARPMFGGHGLCLDGLMFALVARDTLYLNVDGRSRAGFQAAGLEAFEYRNKRGMFRISYHAAPEEALDDAEVLRHRARKAVDAAVRSARER